MICYLIFSVLIAAAAFTVRRRSLLRLTGAAFYAVQAAFAVRIVAGGLYGETSAVWFAFDAAGTLFYCLLCIVSAFAFFHSKASLHDCDLRQTRTYAGLLMLLTTAIAGAYFASNLAVTWIFLEATTLCSAGIVYHRRTAQALEAAWKYVFVCSTGIAMAYLGILLLAAATDCESLDYATVAAAAPGGSALYLKTAFLLILCGYSCKAELFPLYTVGVDANFAAPAPASALISTGLVNAGFLALLRVYKLLAATEVFPWVKSVLLLVGVLSLVVGALFLRRTNNYKRFLSYSTVENMGIAAIGLGIGGIGVWAAVFHVVCHTLIKSSLFLQIAVVRQVYGNYRINRIGDYIHINRVGAVGLLTGMVVLVAFPPSPLFLSELMILKQTIADGRWWLVTGIMLLLCLVIYFFCSRLLRLCYQPRQDELHPSATDRALSWSALSLLAAAIVLASKEAVEKYGLKPMAKLVSWGHGGVDPKIMGVGPVPASRQAMSKAGLKIEDIDLVEANEAFAAQSIAVARELGFDMEKVNVNGGAIAIGHPVGCSGARIIVTLLHEMAKRPDAKKGLATLCIGGGMGVATIFEKC